MSNENLKLYKQRTEMDLASIELTDEEYQDCWDEAMLDVSLTITADGASAVVRLFETFPVLQGGSVVKSLRSQLAELGIEP